ncbi:hypothetical protein ACS0Y7_04540 [Burkholderia gladioli]|uniref:hypothetical protein n=1 Tax=Burkholderia gladioli TaxID=28095 RepID=UPI001C5DFF65|nr:hypothetical protein [Burkholderia gladioli]MBW5284572.1 hypothetical protein [Burkholderia gladioli]
MLLVDDEWLHTSKVYAARMMLRLYAADEMVAVAQWSRQLAVTKHATILLANAAYFSRLDVR